MTLTLTIGAIDRREWLGLSLTTELGIWLVHDQWTTQKASPCCGSPMRGKMWGAICSHCGNFHEGLHDFRLEDIASHVERELSSLLAPPEIIIASAKFQFILDQFNLPEYFEVLTPEERVLKLSSEEWRNIPFWDNYALESGSDL